MVTVRSADSGLALTRSQGSGQRGIGSPIETERPRHIWRSTHLKTRRFFGSHGQQECSDLQHRIHPRKSGYFGKIAWSRAALSSRLKLFSFNIFAASTKRIS